MSKNRSISFFQIFKMKKRKFNIGSGGITENGWWGSDVDELDITKESDWKNLLKFLKLDNIMAEHVWEHLTDEDTELANVNCFKYLKKKGVLRLAVPDGFHPDKSYIEYVRPGGSGAGADDHKILYNYHIMNERLQKAGFKTELLEYWDENGNFHFKDWNNEAGLIRRSRRYDERNINGQMNYTSLIIDAIKPG
jgi:predicted SAM-dependent methyltransferase